MVNFDHDIAVGRRIDGDIRDGNLLWRIDYDRFGVHRTSDSVRMVLDCPVRGNS